MEREECSHEVEAALQAEVEHFERWRRAAGAEALEASLRWEMLALLPQETVSLPERVGSHVYYVR